jgi:hypothetical protein
MDGFDLLEVYIVEEGKDYSDQCNGNKKYSWLNDFKNDIFKKWSASKWNQSMHFFLTLQIKIKKSLLILI